MDFWAKGPLKKITANSILNSLIPFKIILDYRFPMCPSNLLSVCCSLSSPSPSPPPLSYLYPPLLTPVSSSSGPVESCPLARNLIIDLPKSIIAGTDLVAMSLRCCYWRLAVKNHHSGSSSTLSHPVMWGDCCGTNGGTCWE